MTNPIIFVVISPPSFVFGHIFLLGGQVSQYQVPSLSIAIAILVKFHTGNVSTEFAFWAFAKEKKNFFVLC